MIKPIKFLVFALIVFMVAMGVKELTKNTSVDVKDINKVDTEALPSVQAHTEPIVAEAHAESQKDETPVKQDEKPVKKKTKPAPQPVDKVERNARPISSNGDCASELSKYDWPQGDAYKIMFQESRNKPINKNDNPSTGDYSIGCFQINLFGNLALTRPSETWLYNPVNNVSYAYKMYLANGRQFCTTSGWLNSCITTGVTR